MRNLLILIALALPMSLQSQEVVFIGQTPVNKQISGGITVASRDITGGIYTYRCDSISDQVQINAAIEQSAENGGLPVYLSSGKFVIDGTIIIKSNVQLIAEANTKIYLADGADCYMLMNENVDVGSGGDSAFIVSGGRWYGRAPLQERAYPASPLPPDAGFFGWGFVFHLCKNIIIKDMYIEDTEAWAIAYFHCDNVKFLDIEIVQLQTKGHNQDGITGNSNKNILIDGLTVACADDPIAMGCSTSHLGYLGSNPAHYILWGDGYDCENLTFRNIYSNRILGGEYGFPVIGLYPAENRTIRNVVIENVYGGCAFHDYGVVHILNAFVSLGGVGYVDNISLNNFDVVLDHEGMSILHLGALGQTTGLGNYLRVKNLSASNIIARTRVPEKVSIFNLSSCLENGSFNNINCFDSASIKHTLMTVNTSVDSIKINVGFVDPTNDLDNIIIDTNTGTNDGLRINAPFVRTNIARINAPREGDRVIDVADGHPLIYLSGAWVDLYD